MGSSSEVGKLFKLLESNKLSDVEKVKKIFHDHFLSTKDNCLVNGLVDYFFTTNSLRAIEVLAGVRDPHDKHLLDRLAETLAKPTSHNQRVQALIVLGHIARRQPTWLYKLTSHSLFRELLKLLKYEVDALSIVSALLLLVTLLPMLPAALGPYLNDIFEVFNRLASYYHNQSNSLNNLPANSADKDSFYLLHLHLGLYNFFHRLYAMYPCSLISYLRHQHAQRDQDYLATFKHTIKPMLDSVRMHPLLITASRDTETNAARWKQMEHHDVVAECGHFAFDRNREEMFATNNLRATPLPDQQCPLTPINIVDDPLGTGMNNDLDEDTLWSPSMKIPPHSPKSIQTINYEPRSAPSTPNNSTNRSNSSPPEAAIEATPETTPVKDIRQTATRSTSVGSAAVRALSAFGNGSLTGNSRPATPSSNVSALSFVPVEKEGIVSQKISRLLAERNNSAQLQQINIEGVKKILENSSSQNGKNDSWKEDQEVVEIVNCHPQVNHMEAYRNRDDYSRAVNKNLTKKFRLCKFDSPSHPAPPVSRPASYPDHKVRRSKSCSDLKYKKETGVQTDDLFPYEYLLHGIVDQRSTEQQTSRNNNTDSRLSPTLMLDRYIENCASVLSIKDKKVRSFNKKKGLDDDNGDNINEDSSLIDVESVNQQLQLMQMQLLFERQRREVHAERNRRLLGKLRDSRTLQEQKTELADRLRIMESEVESLKNEIERSKRESRITESDYKKAVDNWQSKCLEEYNRNRKLAENVEVLELDIKKEKTRVAECEQQTRVAEATFFDAAHQLKDALKAASRSEELKRILDNVQKKFLLLSEAQNKYHERASGPVPMLRQEATQIHRAYEEELVALKRQLDSRTSTIEALRTRLVELENREAYIEGQLVDQQRILQETNERNEAELRAVESKYDAQVAINLLLERRILELHSNLEIANCGGNSSGAGAGGSSNSNNLAYSASPKDRSPPLSGSLASSSEGSIAFHTSTGIMSDYCDSAGEIANLLAIVEPVPQSTSQATTPVRTTSQRRK
ncbi:hamartin [Microplitis demolitor]|uniref:hamartin n=1 Tax=Microplitis demolitor TaxID=69319 RepID=UPI0004CCB655|nr:hamartin [Microplitis demolitor]